MIFTKTMSGGTDKVWFYDMRADGYSLDDKRTPLGDTHEQNNIADIITRFHHLGNEENRSRSEQSFFVPKAEIAENGYDLSINRYKEVVYESVDYGKPLDILADIERLEGEIADGLKELKALIS